MTHTVEHHIRIYDDKRGWYVTVRPDSDTGDCCEIAWNDGNDAVKDERSIVIPWPMARLTAQAILDQMSPEPGDAA